jgi:TetR/AcrR family transcriptional regulator, tetracycline repressor protein
VRASALYRHYPSKQALLDAMVAYLATPSADAAPPSGGTWDERLRDVATGMRQIMLAHRDGARLIATFHHPGNDAVATFHDLIAALAASGVPAETAVLAVDTVLAYVNGFTIEEQARKIGAEGWQREQRDAAFRDGLELILAGVRESAVSRD